MEWITLPRSCNERHCKFEIKRDEPCHGYVIKHGEYEFFVTDKVTEAGIKKDLDSINAIINALHTTEDHKEVSNG